MTVRDDGIRAILILGVTGQSGREVARGLLEHGGVDIRGTARDAARVDVPGVTPLAFDWQQPATWDAVLAEPADAAFFPRPEILDGPERIAAFLARARGVVDRVVMLGEIGVERLPAEYWGVRVEQAVRDSGVGWTFLRPPFFHQALIDDRQFRRQIVDRGVIDHPTSGSRAGWVDVRDIAEVAVRALLDDTHDGRAYTLTGPESITMAEVAQRLSGHLGRAVDYVDGSPEEAIAKISSAGAVDPAMIDWMWAALTTTANGKQDRVSQDIEQVTGHAPRSLDDFIVEHLPAWS